VAGIIEHRAAGKLATNEPVGPTRGEFVLAELGGRGDTVSRGERQNRVAASGSTTHDT
jgi:hypothetical protein